jgi:hypothetical protein
MFLPDRFRLLLPRHRRHPRRQGRSSFRTKRSSISESGYQIELKTSASFLLVVHSELTVRQRSRANQELVRTGNNVSVPRERNVAAATVSTERANDSRLQVNVSLSAPSYLRRLLSRPVKAPAALQQGQLRCAPAIHSEDKSERPVKADAKGVVP